MQELKLKKGDVCKVIANIGEHHFEIGEIVTIKQLIPDGVPPHYRCDSKNDFWWLYDEELELIK